jgi:hypothetical protein
MFDVRSPERPAVDLDCCFDLHVAALFQLIPISGEYQVLGVDSDRFRMAARVWGWGHLAAAIGIAKSRRSIETRTRASRSSRTGPSEQFAASPHTIDPFCRAAGYVDRILKGEKAAELPVQAPANYAPVISLKAAKSLGC